MKRFIAFIFVLFYLFAAIASAQNTKKGFYFSAELGTNANFDSKYFYGRSIYGHNINVSGINEDFVKSLIPQDVLDDVDKYGWTDERIKEAAGQAKSYFEDFSANHEKKAIRKSRLIHTGVDVNAKLAFGYRVCNQFVVAAGTGAYMSTNSQMPTFSIPLFLRLRSDFLNGKFSPYAELDLGYAFMFKNSVIDEDHLGVTYEKDFGHGNYRGTNFMDYDILRNGLFGEFTLGVGWVVGNQRRISLGVGVDLAQCMRGVVMHASEGFHVYAYEEGKTINTVYELDETEWWYDKNGFPKYKVSEDWDCSVFSYGAVKNEEFKRQFHIGMNFKVAFEF